jgi:hypothetical protein
LREIKIKSIYGPEANIIEEAQSQGRIRYRFHTDQFPLNKSGIRVCDIYVNVDDSNYEKQNDFYPELLN